MSEFARCGLTSDGILCYLVDITITDYSADPDEVLACGYQQVPRRWAGGVPYLAADR
jgi:hypothetical protein